MDRSTRIALNELNASFYTRRAEEFSSRRDHAWRGWERMWDALAGRRCGSRTAAGTMLRVVDVGCGNGRLARFLFERCHRDDRPPRDGRRTASEPGSLRSLALDYLGLDACEPLLAIARSSLQAASRSARATLRFERTDLVAQAPAAALPAGPFDLVAAYGLLHHVPGFAQRRSLVEALAGRVAPGGLLALAFWRFGDRDRFRRRALGPRAPEWRALTIAPGELDEGDHLLRWGETGGASALRYCHFSDEREREALLADLALERVADYCTDGREGDLNHHVLLGRPGG